jgi:hypothetical protein
MQIETVLLSSATGLDLIGHVRSGRENDKWTLGIAGLTGKVLNSAGRTGRRFAQIAPIFHQHISDFWETGHM